MNIYLTKESGLRIQAISFDDAQSQTTEEVIGQLIEEGEIINGKAVTTANYENLN